MSNLVQCPVCKQYSDTVTKRWGADCRGALMCDLCADHYVDNPCEEEEQDEQSN